MTDSPTYVLQSWPNNRKTEVRFQLLDMSVNVTGEEPARMDPNSCMHVLCQCLTHTWHVSGTLTSLRYASLPFLPYSYLSTQTSFSWLSRIFLASSWLQYWHRVGSSETAFSTAKFRVQIDLLISPRQFGQVAVSSLSLASAKRWLKQPAHIKWPFEHWKNNHDPLINA